MNIRRWCGKKFRLRRVINMATRNQVFIVKESMTDKFLEALRTPMISKDFFAKCEKASKGINTNRKNK